MFSIDLDKLIPNYFKNKMKSEYQNSLIENVILKEWQNLFKDTCMHGKTSVEMEFLNLFVYSDSLNRLFYRIFNKGQTINIEELIYSIAMYNNWLRLSSDEIINIANSFSKRMNDAWAVNFAVRKELKERFDREMEQLFTEKILDYSMTYKIINNDIEVNKIYFKSFSTQRTEELEEFTKIRVYFRDEIGVVTWKEQYSIDVPINKFSPLEMGFIKTGNDYRLINEDKEEYLRWVKQDDNGNLKLKFSETMIGTLNGEGEFIWVS